MSSYVSPVAHTALTAQGNTPLATLEGVTLGLLWNSKPDARELLDEVAEAIGRRVPLGDVVRDSKSTPSTGAPEEVYANLASRCGAVIFASATWGSCTAWGLHDLAQLERRGIPTLVLAGTPFMALAKAQAKAEERPDARLVEFEYPVPVRDGIHREIAEAIVDDVIDAFLG